MFLQGCKQVPQTPLHTSKVLQEENDTWVDVQVSLHMIEHPTYVTIFSSHPRYNCVSKICCEKVGFTGGLQYLILQASYLSVSPPATQ